MDKSFDAGRVMLRGKPEEKEQVEKYSHDLQFFLSKFDIEADRVFECKFFYDDGRYQIELCDMLDPYLKYKGRNDSFVLDCIKNLAISNVTHETEKSKIVVELPDGRLLNGPNEGKVFSLAYDYVGHDKISTLKIKVKGRNLGPSVDCTPQHMVKLLNRIGESLNIGWKVYFKPSADMYADRIHLRAKEYIYSKDVRDKFYELKDRIKAFEELGLPVGTDIKMEMAKILWPLLEQNEQDMRENIKDNIIPELDKQIKSFKSEHTCKVNLYFRYFPQKGFYVTGHSARFSLRMQASGPDNRSYSEPKYPDDEGMIRRLVEHSITFDSYYYTIYGK